MAAEQKSGGNRSRSKLRRSAPRPLALEPRLMYDGAAVDAAAAVAAATQTDASVNAHSDSTEVGVADFVPPALEPAATTSREIVFVDARVPDYQQLVSGARSDVQVVVIQADEDGLQIIDRTLADRSGIAAIHVVTHGSDGAFNLGTVVVDSETLAGRQAEFAAWSSSLAGDADILLYGCDVASSDGGKNLVNQLSALTGADVAASIDDTGAAGGGDWALEYSTGSIEAQNFLNAEAALSYQNRLSSFNLSGASGWTAVMYGVAKDPVGDSQAGAADTDIVGDASHGSLYVAFDDNGTASTADDTMVFRLRIDNPTSSTYFGGVAVVGLDVNLDGRIDVFVSVDGRNNGQALKILDPGTSANISPNTTSTSPLPTGWLASNGVYSFSAGNYSVVAVSAATDPNWNGDNDLGNDGHTDVFVNWRISINDLATVLAKPSLVDRNGNYGPRGSSGIAGFTENTSVQYVNFTQTQTGPINGDLNGVGATYDKNATFTSLGAFTPQMTAKEPVSAGPTISIDSPAGGNVGADGVWSSSEDGSIVITGTSENLAQGTVVTVTVTDGSLTKTATGTVQANGAWSVTFSGGQAISGLSDGSLTISASADPDSNAGTSNDIHDALGILHDRTAPTITIDALATAVSGKPTLSGTSNLSDGSLITVTIDADNNPATADLVYQVMVVSGAWSLNTATVTPVSGSMPASGLTSYSKITATATDAAGNSASAVALNRPTVTTLSTNDTTPVIGGTWTKISGDVLTVTVNGATYTLAPSGNTWSIDLGTATPSSGSLSPLVAGNTYSVTATVTRGGASVSDTTGSEVTITSTPVKAIDITGGATASGVDTTPTLTGTSANAGGFVIVRLDPGNDGNLGDAVTYSVATDGSGNWSLDTGTATPIAGTAPSGGFVGAIGIVATDSTGAVTDVQVLTISTPTVAIGSITSAASTDAYGQVSNTGGGAAYLNMTEDNSVSVSGTATNGFTVDVVITDVNGHYLSYSNVAVSGGAWSISGKDLSSLDSGTLTIKATLSGTGISATNTGITHDKIAPLLINTTQSVIQKTSGAVIKGSSDLASGTALTVTLYSDSGYTTAISGQTYSTTVAGDGTWAVTTTSNLSGSTVYVKVAPTSTTTDSAGNIAQALKFAQTINQSTGNSNATINVKPITGDNLILSDEIASGLVINGESSVTSATITVVVTDGTTTVTKTTTSGSTYSAGTNNWSVTLTTAEIQSLKNGQITVTGQVTDATKAVVVSDVELPTLNLPSPTLAITDNVPGTAAGVVTFTFTFSEAVSGFDASDIIVTGGTKGTFSGSGNTYTLTVTPTANSSGTISVSVANDIATGSTTGRTNVGATATQAFNTTGAAAAPTLTIDADNLASSSTPIITGTTSLPAGAPIVIAIDPDNDSGTADALTYSATVQSDGTWSLDISTATPTSGALPAPGLLTYAKITATATNAYGNSTSVTAIDKPAVVSQISSDNTPTLTGTWSNIAGDSLSVTVTPSGGGASTTYAVGSGLTISGNTWSITSGTLSDGAYDVTATVTRSGTSKTDISSGELIVDTVATVDIAGGGSITTSDSTPTITGTAAGVPAGTLLTLSLDTDNDGSYDLVYKTTIQADGSWSVDTASAAPHSGVFPSAGLNGAVPMQASATDSAGNVAVDTQTLIVDVTPPMIGFTSGTRTPDTTPLISGTTDLSPGDAITIYIDPNNDGNWSDQQTYHTTVAANGTWSIQTTTALSGTVKVRATGSDAMGNTITVEQPLIIDLNAPTVSVTPVATANNDFIADASEDDAVIISGNTTGVSNGESLVVTVTDGSITISDTVVVNNGAWQLAPLNLSALASGQITVTATYVDGGGNGYPATTVFEHDKSTTVGIDNISEDTGLLADFVTKDSTVSVFGSATPNTAVSIVVKDVNDNAVASFSVTADGAGVWSTGDTNALSPGDYIIYATVSGGATASKAMTIVDATAPVLVASSPADDATSFAVADNLSLTFNKNVQSGTGFISLYKADGSLVESFNVDTGVGDHGGSLVFDGAARITLNPAGDLTLATGYYIKIDASAVVDSAGNAFAGIGDDTTLNFNTGSGVSAPSQVISIVEMTKDSGVSGDFVTSDGSAGRTVSGTISGALGASEVLEVSFDAGATWNLATTTGTDWSIGDSNAYSADWSIEARIRNTVTTLFGSAATQSVTLDTTVPAAPAVDALVTTSVAPTLTGAANVNAGETLHVSVNGATYVVVPSGAAWSLDLATANPVSGTLGTLAAGHRYAVTATVTDLAGNAASDLTTNELAIASPDPTQTPVIVSMTKDTGASSSDFITGDGTATRTVAGTLMSNLAIDEVVEVSFDGGANWLTANTTGTNWSVSDAGSHSGDWSIKARVTNGTTQVSGPEAAQSVTLDSTAPAVPTVDTLLTTSTAPTLTGHAILSAGEALRVTVNGATYSVTPGAGTWSLDLSTAVPVSGTLGAFVPGSRYAVSANITDLAGNSAADVTTDELTIAAPNPTQTPIIKAMSKDTGVAANDFITDDGSAGRTVSGELVSGLQAGEAVEVSFDGGGHWTTATVNGANWSVDDSSVHSSNWVIQARVRNSTTNATGPTATQAVVLDTTIAPAAPTQTPVIVSMSKDTGASPNDFITADGGAGRTVTGALTSSLNAGEVLEVSFDAGTTWTAAAVTGTTWSATDVSAHAGDWTIQARVTQSATHVSGPIAMQRVQLDRAAPSAPTVEAITTTSTTPTLRGTAIVGTGETLTVTVNGATYIVVPSNGEWVLDLAAASPVSGVLDAFDPGVNYSVTATIIDAAGNTASDATRGELSIAVPPIPMDPPPSVPTPLANVPPVTITTTQVVKTTANEGFSVAPPSSTAPAVDRANTESVALQPDFAANFGVSSSTANAGLYTRSDGFQVIVLRADAGGAQSVSRDALVLNRGIPDVNIGYAGREIEVPIPRDAFAHTRNEAVIALTVIQADGRPLPAWLKFDARLGMFRGVPPKGLHSAIEIRVVARDQAGNQVETTFRIYIDDTEANADQPRTGRLGKASLSEQLRQAKSAREQSMHKLTKLAGNGQRARHAAHS